MTNEIVGMLPWLLSHSIVAPGNTSPTTAQPPKFTVPVQKTEPWPRSFQFHQQQLTSGMDSMKLLLSHMSKNKRPIVKEKNFKFLLSGRIPSRWVTLINLKGLNQFCISCHWRRIYLGWTQRRFLLWYGHGLRKMRARMSALQEWCMLQFSRKGMVSR